MRHFLNFLFYGFMLLSFCSCKKEIHTLKDFNQLINDEKSGYKQMKSVNGVLVTVLYTPPEYIALKKMEALNKKNQAVYDSLLEDSKLSASFIMVLGPDESKGNTNDIMYDGITNFKEYAERSLTLNFDMEKNVELHVNEQTYSPVLSSLENTYGLSKDRKVNLAFAPLSVKTELAQADNFDFVYTDESFEIGVLHFYFDKKKIQQDLPEITIR